MKTIQEYNEIKQNEESLKQALIEKVLEESENLIEEDIKEWESLSAKGFEFEEDGITYSVTISSK